MAYPSIDKPYGFQPVNRYDGIPYAGATLQIPIGALPSANAPTLAKTKVAIWAGMIPSF